MFLASLLKIAAAANVLKSLLSLLSISTSQKLNDKGKL